MLSFRTLRVAVLTSKRATGLDELMHHPHRGRLFEIACVVTTSNAFADGDRIEAAGIPVLCHPIRHYSGARAEYDRVTADVLKQLGIDTVLLLGYMYVLTAPMLDAFPGRIVNIHDADLTLMHRYAGLHSTRDAIRAGERETRSTVHYVTEEVDAGPVLLVSRAYPVAPFAHEAVLAGHDDIVKAYAYAHREWMMRDSWGSLAVSALEAIAAGAAIEEIA